MFCRPLSRVGIRKTSCCEASGLKLDQTTSSLASVIRLAVVSEKVSSGCRISIPPSPAVWQALNRILSGVISLPDFRPVRNRRYYKA